MARWLTTAVLIVAVKSACSPKLSEKQFPPVGVMVSPDSTGVHVCWRSRSAVPPGPESAWSDASVASAAGRNTIFIAGSAHSYGEALPVGCDTQT